MTATGLYLLQFGAECVPKSLSVRGGDQRLFWSPITGALVETTAGLILFDTGMGAGTHACDAVDAVYRDGGAGGDPDRATAIWPTPPRDGRWTWGDPHSPLAATLAEHGFAVGDLALAVVSHLHWDHSGGIAELARAGVPVAIHQDELAFGRSGTAAFGEGFTASDWTSHQPSWVELSGDTQVADGVTVLSTPGHTPGHVSLRVDLADTGTWLFPADAADLGQNFLDAVPCGSVAGDPDGERRADESLEKLTRLAVDTRARLVCGHDQLVFNAARHPRGGHR